ITNQAKLTSLPPPQVVPPTPSAKRVPVDSSPSTNIITNIASALSPQKKAKRAVPASATTEVWQLSIWDPSPMSLPLLAPCYPVHVALYFLAFPIAPTRSHSTSSTSQTATYLAVLIMEALRSFRTSHLVRYFERQHSDKLVLSKEVLHA